MLLVFFCQSKQSTKQRDQRYRQRSQLMEATFNQRFIILRNNHSLFKNMCEKNLNQNKTIRCCLPVIKQQNNQTMNRHRSIKDIYTNCKTMGFHPSIHQNKNEHKSNKTKVKIITKQKKITLKRSSATQRKAALQ